MDAKTALNPLELGFAQTQAFAEHDEVFIYIKTCWFCGV
jgi:hypothetical protein